MAKKNKKKKKLQTSLDLLKESLLSKLTLGTIATLSSIINQPSPNLTYQINFSSDLDDEIASSFKKYNQNDLFYKLVKTINIKDKIKIVDNRINGNGIFTGYYPKWIIGEIIKESLKNDVDPYLAVTIALAESRIGESGIVNSYQNLSFDEEDEEKIINFAEKHLNEEEKALLSELKKIDIETYNEILRIYAIKYNISVSIKSLKKKIKIGEKFVEKNLKRIDKSLKDAYVIQAYNGYGKLETFKLPHYKEYMSQKEMPDVIDMSKNPYYGIKVIDLMENSIYPNVEIKNMIHYIKNAMRKK